LQAAVGGIVCGREEAGEGEVRGESIFYTLGVYMEKTVYDKVVLMQNCLIDCATGRSYTIADYEDTRRLLLAESKYKLYVPDFVSKCRTLEQFWPFVKKKYSTYRERREFIWESFEKLLSLLENESNNPLDNVVSISMSGNADAYIKEQWNKALERRATDPEGAITTARALVESTCKYILDSINIHYQDDIELPKLYNLTASQLNLAPQNHQEEIFKQILGGCQSVINGLGSLRNKIGDAHGKGVHYVKPHERHAKLAVNLAGTLSSFLIETFNQKQNRKAQGATHAAQNTANPQ